MALVNLKFILSFISFIHLILSYGLFMDFKSRAINHGLRILYEHWHVITIKIVGFCEIPFIGYFVMTKFTGFPSIQGQ